MRRLLLSAALVALGSGQATAKDRLSWLDLFAPDRIAQQMVQFAIMSLRTQMDLKYGDLSVDLLSGRVTLSDIKMWPLPPWDQNGDCVVEVKRLTIRSGALDQADRLRFKAHISGATAPLSCLPPEGRGAVGMAGLDRLEVPRLTMDLDYGVPESDAVVRVFGVVENAAAVDLTADFAYVWVDGRQDMEEPDPVVFLENARLTVENRGIWEAMSGQLPPPMADPQGSPLFIEGAIGSAIADMNDGAPISDSQKAFIASIKEAWPMFLANPDRLVLETSLPSDTFLDFEAMERSPVEAFDMLQPRLTLAPAAVADLLPVSLLQSAMGDGAGAMSPEDRRRAGLAMMTGVGAPRNIEAGFDLLRPMAEEGDGEAALALSQALEARDPEEAYGWALLAGAEGAAGATARLDRLEAELEFDVVLQLQEDVSGEDKHPVEALASTAAIRDHAVMRLEGRGVARSYATAAMWAMLGTALGDAESADILRDIDETVRLAGGDAQGAWRNYEARASELATEAWIGQDLPARFAP